MSNTCHCGMAFVELGSAGCACRSASRWAFAGHQASVAGQCNRFLACLGAAIAGLVFTPALEQVTAYGLFRAWRLAAFLLRATRFGRPCCLPIWSFNIFSHLPSRSSDDFGAATAGPAVAAWGLKRLEVDLALASVRDVLRYAVVAALLGRLRLPAAGVAPSPLPSPSRWGMLAICGCAGRWPIAWPCWR